jgi:hypothetical protein
MTPEIFAEWLKRQGRHVVRTASTWWYDQGPRCYQAFPYHWLIHPTEEELAQFIRQTRALSVRYSTSMDAPVGRMSYHMVYERSSYDFEDLGKRTRKNVRRGLKSCCVEPIGMDRLADEGWPLHHDTLDRQGRSAPSRRDWQSLCLTAADLPGVEAWGALVSDRLAASIIAIRLDDYYCILHQQCLREYLAVNVNNALAFTFTQHMLGQSGIRSIFYGLHSLDANPALDQFKLHMGYTAKPVRQRVVFNPWCAPLVNRVTHRALAALVRLRPSSRTLAKGEGMMRFYLEGKQPIDQQSVPAILAASQQEQEQPLFPESSAHLHP